MFMVAGALIAIATLQLSASVVPGDASLDTFWAKFKTAVIKRDKEAVSTMCQFPITMPYRIRSIRTKAQFMRRYRELFNDQTDAAKCFAEAKPEVDPSTKNAFTIACKDLGGMENISYGFERKRGVWKLSYLDNIAE
jgi:hypothetical protein